MFLIKFSRTKTQPKPKIISIQKEIEAAETITNIKIKIIKDQIGNYIVQEINMFKERIVNLRCWLQILVRVTPTKKLRIRE